MELRQLKYFLAVADSRSFVSAAENLYISRQAVSKAVSQLEAELNVELFMRDPSGVFLTPAGVIFYERVRSNVLELEQLRSEMQQYGSQFRQVIRVAFSVGTLQRYETRLHDFILRQKNVIVEYSECLPEACEQLLLERKADVVITSFPMDNEGILTSPLDSASYGVLLQEQQELSQLEQVELQDLVWLPLACLADGQTEKFCKGGGLTPQYTGIDLLRLVRMAGQGQCAAILPQWLADTSGNALRWIPLSGDDRWQVYHGCLKTTKNNALFQSVLDELMLQVFDIR